jgi:hypothetical protein
VKNFAKLVLFFSLSFAGILFFASLIRLLQEWTSSVVFFPPSGTAFFFSGNVVRCIGDSLPAAFYISILLGLNYAARRQMAYPAVFVVILVFVLVLSAGVFLGLDSIEEMGGGTVNLEKPPENLAQPGLILVQSNSLGGSTQTVFLEDPYKQGGARAVSVRGQSLYYLSNGSPVTQVRLSFTGDLPPFFGSIDADLKRSSSVFAAWFTAGFLPYAVYAGSLAVFLLSLGCLINISFWSLANLFFGALAFRGALLLESFLNQGNIRRLLASFAGKVINESLVDLINPVIFAALGVLILLYSGLVYLARGRISNG